MPESATPLLQPTPVSKQHEALVPSSFAPWILVPFVIGPIVCHVCRLVLWILSCMMFIFCVQDVHLAMGSFGA